MTNVESSPRLRWIFLACLAGVLAFVVAKAVIVSLVLDGDLAILGNDSAMRLLLVQNWLGGQGWFDMVQYRLMPPEGVLMHWSRYIDAMIGGLIVVFSWIYPDETAQTIALTVWPTILSVLMVLVIGFGTKRLFGPIAACFAMLCTVLWPFTSEFYFMAGAIDHHNVHILMIVLVTFAIVWPDQPIRSGLVAGVSAAFALAIGLETLPYILVIGALLLTRAHLGITPIADRLLAVFCLTLAVASVVFWLGQTPWSQLSNPVCDQLGLPVLSLIAVASVASVVPIFVFSDKALGRFVLSIVLTALGCALAWPLLGLCITGPYGSLPAEVQDIIRTFISEGKPGIVFAQTNLLDYIRMMVPVVGAVTMASVFWLQLGATPDADRRRDTIVQLLILSAVGVLASFSQIRLLLMTAAAVPVLVGFVLSVLLEKYLRGRRAVAALGLLVTSIVLLSPAILEAPIKQLLPFETPARTMQDKKCRKDAALTELNALAPSVFLTPMNLGPALLFTTHHSSISGPYHRSPAAFANGYIPFNLPEAEMQAYIAKTNATHLLLCAGTTYGEGFARDIVNGAEATWLKPVSIEAGDLLVFEIN
jgi:asparagine N-glycosylation enzyme membrane subunit Stt3